MKRFKGAKGLICLLVMCVLVVGYFYYLSNRDYMEETEEETYITANQEVLLRDLENNYPPTPKEVIKYYCEITKCLHDTNASDEEVELMAEKIKGIYDDELIANKSQEAYLADLKSEILTFNETDSSIVNYAVSASTDVDYFEEDGFEFARLRATLYVRVKTKMQNQENVYLLRKDADGHWKIYGWKAADEVNIVETEDINSNE